MVAGRKKCNFPNSNLASELRGKNSSSRQRDYDCCAESARRSCAIVAGATIASRTADSAISAMASIKRYKFAQKQVVCPPHLLTCLEQANANPHRRCIRGKSVHSAARRSTRELQQQHRWSGKRGRKKSINKKNTIMKGNSIQTSALYAIYILIASPSTPACVFRRTQSAPRAPHAGV